jgi:hypothetical protein
MAELPPKVEMSIADLMVYQGAFAMCLGNALEKAGVLNRNQLADELGLWGYHEPTSPARDLMKIVSSVLRDSARDPNPPGLRVIEGGKP